MQKLRRNESAATLTSALLLVSDGGASKPPGGDGLNKTAVSAGGVGGGESGAGCGGVEVEGLDSPAVVAIAFAAFFIGVLLTAALWYIHNNTGEERGRPRVLGGVCEGYSRGDTIGSLIPYDTRIVFDTRYWRCKSSLYKLKLPIILGKIRWMN